MKVNTKLRIKFITMVKKRANIFAYLGSEINSEERSIKINRRFKMSAKCLI
jgi:hypothetical protein